MKTREITEQQAIDLLRTVGAHNGNLLLINWGYVILDDGRKLYGIRENFYSVRYEVDIEPTSLPRNERERITG